MLVNKYYSIAAEYKQLEVGLYAYKTIKLTTFTSQNIMDIVCY